MYAYCISCVLHLIHIYTCILKLCYTELIVHLFPYDSENMIFLVEEKEKKNLGWVFLVNVAGVGLSQGRVCRGVGLSQGCVCRWGAFVAGVGLSWGGFVAGRVCRGEGLSGVGLSVYRSISFLICTWWRKF